jgi:hypothetical protein
VSWVDAIDDEAIERFWEKVLIKDPDGCWLWTGAVDLHGYGAVKIAGGARKAHRMAWFMANGSLDSKLHIDHLCRNRLCMNPMHQEAVPRAVNGRRARYDQLNDEALGFTTDRLDDEEEDVD